MAELTQHDARSLAGAINPYRRPVLFAVTANLTLAIVLLGVPYWRGRILGQETRGHFVSFVQCLIGGERAAQPGLSLPRGEREHYAGKVLLAGADWPSSCRPILQKLSPEPAIFLWPSVKTAGADLRATVELMERELTQLNLKRKSAPGRVPSRPLQALTRLQGATVLFARAAGVTHDLDNDSVSLAAGVKGVPAPAHLPIAIGESLGLEAWTDTGVLEVLSFDARSLAYLRVEGSKLDRQRIARNKFLRGVVRAVNTPYLVFAMPEDRCAELSEHCVHRPTGLSRYDSSKHVLGEPTWKIAGHPAGRLDRSLAITETGRIDLLSLANAEGGLELRRTRLPLQPAGALEPVVAPNTAPGASETVRVPTEESWPVLEQAAAISATLVAGEPLAVLYASDGATVGDGVQASVRWTGEPTRNLPLETAAGSGAWAVACTAQSARFLAYGSSSEVRVASLKHAANAADAVSVRSLTTQTLPSARIEAPIDATTTGKDHVRLVCTEQQARLLYVDDAQVLWQVQCSAAANSCEAAREVARDVLEFSALQRGELTILAFHGGPRSPTVRVLRLDEHALPMGQPSVVASCWEPSGGMCGRTTLVGDNERVLLLTRDGADVLALETGNNAYSFTTLSGFAVEHGAERDTVAPLQQYRKRKGMTE